MFLPISKSLAQVFVWLEKVKICVRSRSQDADPSNTVPVSSTTVLWMKTLRTTDENRDQLSFGVAILLLFGFPGYIFFVHVKTLCMFKF